MNQQKTILSPQPTKDAPYIIDNYPYGFQQRTVMRVWVDTTRHGQRYATQTQNPKTGLWNKEKYSTYNQIIIVYLDELGHCTHDGLSASYTSISEANAFYNAYGAVFSPYQLQEYQGIIGLLNVYSKVTYTIKKRFYKNRKTGEVSESVNIFDLADCFECDEEGEPVDTVAAAKAQKDANRAVNILAVRSAQRQQGGELKTAIETFKRC